MQFCGCGTPLWALDRQLSWPLQLASCYTAPKTWHPAPAAAVSAAAEPEIRGWSAAALLRIRVAANFSSVQGKTLKMATHLEQHSVRRRHTGAVTRRLWW